MSPHEFELAATILARLLLLDDTSRFPDVQEIREVAREILTEQLRELEDATDRPTAVAHRRAYPRTG